MLVSNTIVLVALAAFGAAQDVDDNDVPQQCRDVCSAVVTLTRDCDAQFDDNDSGYLNCVCSAQGSSSQVPLCDACIAASGDADNDVNDLVRSCTFSSTSYTSGATAATSISNSAGTITSAPVSGGSTSTFIYTTTVPDDDDDDTDFDTSTITSRTVIGGAAATPAQSSATGATGTAASAASSGTAAAGSAASSAMSSASSVLSSASGAAQSAASSASSAAGAKATGVPMLGAAAGAAMIAFRML